MRSIRPPWRGKVRPVLATRGESDDGHMKRRRVTLRESFSAAEKANSVAKGPSGWEPLVVMAFAIWWRIVGLPEDDPNRRAP